MAISNEEHSKRTERVVQLLVQVAKTEDEKLIRKVIESMEVMFKQQDEVLDPLWAQKQVVAILRDNKRKKILEDKNE